MSDEPSVLNDPLLEARQRPPLHGDRATLPPGNVATLIFTVAQVHLLPSCPSAPRRSGERVYASASGCPPECDQCLRRPPRSRVLLRTILDLAATVPG